MTDTNGWKSAGLMQKTDRTWNPETEKTIQGILTENREVTKKDGTKSKVYVIKEPNGKLASVWSAAMLDRLMNEASIGNEVKIEFVEKTFNKETGRSLKVFKLDYRSVEKGDITPSEVKEEVKEEDKIPF